MPRKRDWSVYPPKNDAEDDEMYRQLADGTGYRSGKPASNRTFPGNNGTQDGRGAYVQRRGRRTVAYSGPDNVGKVASNDGENADYVRNDDGEVVVDSNSPDPYNPKPWRRH